MFNRALAVAALALAALPLAGCLGSGSDEFDFVPGTNFKETGRTVHLKATVVDYDSELFPGLDTWLWAFCFEPVDPNDQYSANAIEGWTPLAGDKAVGTLGANAKCSVPGPTLRVTQGDRVKVEFAHNHFHPHTIHWHGQFVPWESDGAPGVTQDAVESGGAITYDFIAKRAGTLWYHCHVDTQLHVMQGLYGMMIVEPQDTTYEPKDIDREYTMVLSTMNRNTVEAVGTTRHSHPPGCASGFPGCENPSAQAGDPDVFLLNGHSYPYTMDQAESLIVVKPGERIRLRILNAGETVEELHPHGHDMQVVAQDGNPIAPDARKWVDVLKIGPAERFDVVITADNPGPWMIHTHVSSHETNCGRSPGGMHTMLVYEEYLDRMHAFKSELPASGPAGCELRLPSDFTNLTSFATGSATPSSPAPTVPVPIVPAAFTATWSFPVELPCAVKRLEFRAGLSAESAKAPSSPTTGTDLDVVVKKPDGSTVEQFNLGNGAASGSYLLEKHTLSTLTSIPGNYTIEVSGQAVQGDLDLFATVEYHSNFEDTKRDHLTYKVGGCPGWT
ncbi:MAG: multicopper oxidase domain-containing protein [Candidatus Thermoplasmatota archaeon]|jgi:FtsP/CotA-like multicopper oxidase with cupredoxin domain